MKTISFNFHNEQEEKVLLAFLDSLQYDYKSQEEDKEAFELSEEEVQSMLQTKRDFLAGNTTARPWEEIRQELSGA